MCCTRVNSQLKYFRRTSFNSIFCIGVASYPASTSLGCTVQVEKEELRRHLQQAEQSNGRVKAVASMYHNHSVVLTQ